MDTQELTYTLEEYQVTLEDMNRYDVLVVRAYLPSTVESVGYVMVNTVNRECLELYVRTDYRRQGIATRLWAHAREHHGVEHSSDRTADGQAWALSLGEPLPVWVRM